MNYFDYDMTSDTVQMQ